MTPTITSYISVMTSGGLANGFGEATSQPRKGVDGETIPASFLTSFESTLSAGETGTALADQLPASSASPSSGGGNGGNGGKGHHGKDNDSPGGLDPTAEHLLISAGSIGMSEQITGPGPVLTLLLRGLHPGVLRLLDELAYDEEVAKRGWKQRQWPSPDT
jgi:hypothetical protein